MISFIGLLPKNGRICVCSTAVSYTHLNQIRDYYKVFSYVYVVVGNKQLPHVREFLRDKKVGIYELTPNGKLICRKKASYNRDNLSYEALFHVLRKAVFESIILKHFNKLPEVNSFQYYLSLIHI